MPSTAISVFKTASPYLFNAAKLMHTLVVQQSLKPYRHFSTNRNTANLLHIPHAFSRTRAAEIIENYDRARLFAPIPKQSFALTLSNKDPLTTAYLPVCGINATIGSTYYEGEIGKDRTITDTSTDSEGKTTTTTRTVTDWYSTRGTMNGCSYTQDAPNMIIYFGEQYNDRTVEKAVEGYSIQKNLNPFDANKISKEIYIDAWKKVDAYGLTEAAKRISNCEFSRAETHIRQNNWWVDHVRVNRVSIQYRTHMDGRKNFGLTAMMLPVYILENQNSPIRILSAISSDVYRVYGAAPLSDVKVMAATTAAATLLAFFFPQIAIPARVIGVVATAMISGAWTHYGLSLRSTFEERDIERKKEENARFTRGYIDDARLNATSRDVYFSEELSPIHVDAEFYEILGLDPKKRITDEMIQEAFTKKLKSVHSDLGGTDAKTIKVIAARDAFRQAMHPTQSDDGKKRHYATSAKKPNQAQLLTHTPPQSSPHPNTAYLIKLVLEEKNYNKALTLLKTGELNADSHDEKENTLLTEAVKRKDVAGVTFALTQARCAVDLSCDCPLHNTAMHYWAEGAGSDGGKYRAAEVKIFALLIAHNARINLINSAGNTPLDMTTDENARKMLIDQGAVAHRSQNLLVQFKGSLFGYSPSSRTKVIQEQAEEQAKLPPPKKAN